MSPNPGTITHEVIGCCHDFTVESIDVAVTLQVVIFNLLYSVFDLSYMSVSCLAPELLQGFVFSTELILAQS